MSILGSFEVGKKAMTTAQLGQHTTGHNLANVDTEGFSRQEIQQSSARPVVAGMGQGVDVSSVRRHQDGFTKEKVIGEQTSVGGWNTREQVNIELETIFTDLEGNKLRGSMDEFWSAWETLSHQPESPTMRKALVIKSQAMTDRFNIFAKRLNDLKESLNGRIGADIKEINSITKNIAAMNKQVTQIENQGRQANDARDQREALLQKLSGMVEIRYFENERGNLEVQLADGMALVHDREHYDMVPQITPDMSGDVMLGLRGPSGKLTDVTDIIGKGSLKELVLQRDENVMAYQAKLDDLSTEMTLRVNALHSGGTGIKAIKGEEISAHSFTGEALEKPLPMLETGFFQVGLVDSQGEQVESISVYVEGGVDTVDSIIEKVNRAAGAYTRDAEGNEHLKETNPFMASLTENGEVSFKGGEGYRFIYDGDNSNALAVLGLNTFFEGMGSAGTMAVRDEILQDEMTVAVGFGMIPSDNRIAVQISELQRSLIMNEGTQSFDDFYNSQVTQVGLNVQDAQKGLSSHSEMLGQYEAIRDSVSAVNVDEEMANMVKYQRAYESSAKYLSTIDQMTETLIMM